MILNSMKSVKEEENEDSTTKIDFMPMEKFSLPIDKKKAWYIKN
jgi:hypothetical protein